MGGLKVSSFCLGRLKEAGVCKPLCHLLQKEDVSIIEAHDLTS